jgi:hypothetical protein
MVACLNSSLAERRALEGKPPRGSPASLAAFQQAVIDSLALFSPLARLSPLKMAMTACPTAGFSFPMADEKVTLLWVAELLAPLPMPSRNSPLLLFTSSFSLP